MASYIFARHRGILASSLLAYCIFDFTPWQLARIRKTARCCGATRCHTPPGLREIPRAPLFSGNYHAHVVKSSSCIGEYNFISERIYMVNYGKMSTAASSDKHPVHRWFNFIAGYSPEYIKYAIEEYAQKSGRNPARILDPFAGMATTNVVANQLGIPSKGIERNPFFYKIGLAKTRAGQIAAFFPEIQEQFSSLINNPTKEDFCQDNDAIKFLLKLFDSDDLAILFSLRECVYSLNSEEKRLAGFLVLSKMLEYATFAKTDGIYKVPTSKKHNHSCSDSLILTIEDLSFGQDEYSHWPSLSEYCFDSSVTHDLGQDNYDLVVFSPPYLNNFDFAEMTRMQLYFWEEASSWREISEKHRNKMLVNTTTALKDVRAVEQQKELREKLPNTVLKQVDPIVDELHRLRKNEGKSKDYDLIIYPYLAQMMEVVSRCYDAMSSGAHLRIVLSDAAFYGIHIDTQEYIALILKAIGYSNIEVNRMRDRGDRWILQKRKSSGKQLGEFELFASKE